MGIRAYCKDDAEAVYYLHQHAFDGLDEADLVVKLHDDGAALLSLVFEEEGTVVGHILFSALGLDPEPSPTCSLAALAPLAVLPDYQRQGVGDALTRNGLEQLRARGCDGVVVLGHPDYYPRFGFERAARFGLAFPGHVPDEAFLALPLREGTLEGRSGTIVYHAAFGLGEG